MRKRQGGRTDDRTRARSREGAVGRPVARVPRPQCARALRPCPARCDRELRRQVRHTDVATAAATTRGLVSEAVLTALGPEGYLVNIARGSVVEEPALVDALVGGRLAGAALDVFADEPYVPPALHDLDTVLLLPHIASATRETREAMGDLAFRNLRRFMSDGTLLTPVPAPGSSR
ncbi:NAD(P)-dependent oxidoreductase [Actinomadura sp. HBU206391]|uniref:NAD(P)-dependent oxidoreductase n=1 Tax=Actinomadura sp. HBU206391 TaxID=2731692 RepID=UPI002905C8BE|nr:NAD(P)-dependent oxidoreductase [Actinomadura sp. HBU206391]